MADVPRLILEAPLPELIEKLGIAVAEAQLAMDRTGVAIAQLLADESSSIDLGDRPRTLLELGFTPTFYHFSKAVINARVAFSTSRSRELTLGASVGVDIGVFAASINASYTSKYQFDSNGSSSVQANLVSVPAPALLTEILQDLRTDTESNT